MKLFLWRGLPLVLWMGVIFLFSSMPGSPYPFDPPFLYFLERKSAHVVEYAMLTVLTIRFVFAVFTREILSRTLLLAATFSIAYGASDELHQFFVPYRGAKISDVFIDSIGIVLIVSVYYFVYRKKHPYVQP